MAETKIENVYLKLTTVPQKEDLSFDDPLYELYLEKYGEAKNLSNKDAVIKSYLSDAGLNPLFGKILYATLGFVTEEGQIRTLTLQGEERAILIELLNLLNSSFKKSTLVLWNFSFNLPYITTRMMHHKISVKNLPKMLQHQGLKPWDLKQNMDLQAFVDGVGWFKSSLTEHAYNIGIETNFIKSSDVVSYVNAGKTEEVIQSDIDYLSTMVNIHRYTMDKALISEVNSTVRNMDEEEVKIERASLYDSIMRAGAISKDDEEKISDLAKTLKSKKKRKMFVVNIKAALGKKDKDLSKEEKELLNNLAK